MTRLARLFVVATCAVVLWSTTAQAAPLLFGADGSGGNPSNLYIINPATGGVVSTVGAIGFAVTGLAFDPTTRVLYGSTSGATGDPSVLLRIDTLTGAGTVVGEFGVGSNPMADIAFDPDGNLYGWLEPNEDDLYLIDKASGAATKVGESGLGTSNSGLAIDATGTAFFGGTHNEPGLATIDLATGAVVDTIPYVPSLAVGMGLTFDGTGVLYGLERVDSLARNLVTIDPATGALTVIGPTVDQLDALAFQPEQVVPEPGVLALSLLAAIAGLTRSRLRK